MNILEFLKLNEGIQDKTHKAIILVGSPGSGKSYIVKNAIASPDWKLINPDPAYERYMKKAKASMDFSKISNDEVMDALDVHEKAIDVTKKKTIHALHGRLPIVIDKTGRDVSSVLKLKNQLESLGYETLMVYVKVDRDVALKRNLERKRVVDEPFVKEAHASIIKNIPTYKKAFGNNFLEIDNNPKNKNNLTKIWVNINKWLNKTTSNSIANKWRSEQK